MNDLPNRDVVIFTEAVQLPADERAAYLASACGGDAELRQKVEALLHTHDHVGDFLEASPQKASIEARMESSTGEKMCIRDRRRTEAGRSRQDQGRNGGRQERPSYAIPGRHATRCRSLLCSRPGYHDASGDPESIGQSRWQ